MHSYFSFVFAGVPLVRGGAADGLPAGVPLAACRPGCHWSAAGGSASAPLPNRTHSSPRILHGRARSRDPNQSRERKRPVMLPTIDSCVNNASRGVSRTTKSICGISPPACRLAAGAKSLLCSRELHCQCRNPPLSGFSARGSFSYPDCARSVRRNVHGWDCDDGTPDSPAAARLATGSA